MKDKGITHTFFLVDKWVILNMWDKGWTQCAMEQNWCNLGPHTLVFWIV